MEQTLITERKYSGRYVAIRDFKDATVIGDGNDPQEAYQKAVEKGFDDPVIVFVPYKGMAQIY